MAKGDDKRARDQIKNQGTLAQDTTNNLREDTLVPQNQEFWNNYKAATTQAQDEHNSIMDNYKAIANTPTPGMSTFKPITASTVNYTRNPDLNTAIQGYKNFSSTGGFSGSDITDMRERGISPIRSVYANATSALDRNRALQGGYSPNYAAVTGKMSRELSGVLADRVQNVNAELAKMIQAGKLQGLSGLSSASIADSEMAQRAGLANQSALNAASGINAGNELDYNKLNANILAGSEANKLAATQGMSNLFASTPGLVKMFGDQVLNSTDQRLTGQGQQNQLGLGQMNAQIAAGQLPGNFENAMGRINSIVDLTGKVGGALTPWKMPAQKLGPGY